MNSRVKFLPVIVLLALTISFPIILRGQTNPSNVNMIPNIAPPSPDVAKLIQFGNYPVNHYTGLANISIPLYEIKAGEISVPITLNYHTSGIKVTEHSGWVGLGWSLEPGGSISRTVMGLADEIPSGYLSGSTIHSYINSSNASDLLYLSNIARGYKDVEPDIFSYTFGNYSGKFAFNQLDDFSKVMIPYAPVRIDHDYNEYDLDFVAYDPYGIEYRFDSIHEASSGINDYFSVRSAWKIFKIVSSNKQDTVRFSYSSSFGRTFSDISDRIVVEDLVYNPTNTSYFSPSNGSTQSTSNIAVSGNEQKLTEILFPGGKVTFSISARTEDGWSDTSWGTQKKLDTISVYSYLPATDSYVKIRVVIFDYGHFTSTDGSGTKRLRLDSLRICDSNGTTDQKYSFNYNTTYVLPAHLSRGRDLWGYYNGLNNNNSLVPRTTVQYIPYGVTPTNITIGSNYNDGRDPDPSYMDACMLNKITYPAGGWTEFDYETNKYLEGSTSTYTGGLRIYQIKNYSESGVLAKTQTFKYGSNESGYGTKNFQSGNYWLINEVTIKGHFASECNDQPHKRSRTYLSSPSIGIEPYDGSPVVYTEVAVYDGTLLSNNGKTIYRYNYIPDQINSTFQTGYPAIESKHFKRGLMTCSESFTNSAGPSTTVRDSSTYGAFPDSTKYNLGLKVKKTLLYVAEGGYDIDLGTGDACNAQGDVNSYTWAYFDILTGDDKPTSSISYSYSSEDDSDYVTTTTSYDHNNYDHQQVTRTSTVNSDGVVHNKEIDFIQDISSTAVHDSMIKHHMLAFPVIETSKVGSTTLETIYRDYYNPDTHIFTVEDIRQQFGSGPADTLIEFQEIDSRGNIAQFKTKDGIVSSYVWGYDLTQPVAKVENSSRNEILFQNFEDGLTEPWVTPSNPYQTIDHSEAYSGSHSLKAQSYSGCTPACYYSVAHAINAANLDLSDTYRFSAWVKADNVDDYINMQIKYEDGSGWHTPPSIHYDENNEGEWQYLERTIDLSQITGLIKLDLVIRVIGSNGYPAYIDDLRFYPADAEMTTYTHDPLIGVTSITDPNNQTMHYQYDDFGRLIQVTDSDGVLVKEVEYNYVNQ